MSIILQETIIYNSDIIETYKLQRRIQNSPKTAKMELFPKTVNSSIRSFTLLTELTEYPSELYFKLDQFIFLRRSRWNNKNHKLNVIPFKYYYYFYILRPHSRCDWIMFLQQFLSSIAVFNSDCGRLLSLIRLSVYVSGFLPRRRCSKS